MAYVLLKERILSIAQQDATSHPKSLSLPLGRTLAVEQTHLSKHHLVRHTSMSRIVQMQTLQYLKFFTWWKNFYFLHLKGLYQPLFTSQYPIIWITNHSKDFDIQSTAVASSVWLDQIHISAASTHYGNMFFIFFNARIFLQESVILPQLHQLYFN